MEPDFVRARTHVLLTMLRSPTVQHEMEPGQSLRFATVEEQEAATHDEALLLLKLTGRPSTDATVLFEQVRSQLRGEELRAATADEVRRAFA